MKIAIFGQFYNEHTQISVDTLLGFLSKENGSIFIESAFFGMIKGYNKGSEQYDTFNTFETLDNSFELLISIGGDGTILRAITFVRNLEIPIIGINTGRLGFLATIQTNQIEDSIDNILKGNYKTSKRTLLCVETLPEKSEIIDVNFALNEIAVSRKNTTSMITVDTHLNDEYLTSYWADGLIVATPTGSTGYSLSCGGPVITPNAGNFVLTPIAPHNLNARPLVIPDDTKIQLKVDGREDHYLMSLDSRIVTLPNTAIITIKKADFKITMIEPIAESFIDTLRKKLLWGEDKRN